MTGAYAYTPAIWPSALTVMLLTVLAVKPGSIKRLIAAVHLPGLTPVQDGHSFLGACLKGIEDAARLHILSGRRFAFDQCAPIHRGRLRYLTHDRQVDVRVLSAAEWRSRNFIG